MYTADELEIRCALAGSPRAEQLIACLEGEIAKRDETIARLEPQLNRAIQANYDLREELAACRVAVENCDVFRAELAAIKAQEPVQVDYVAVMRADGDGGLEVEWLLEGGTAELMNGMYLCCVGSGTLLFEEGSGHLYAAPVSEANAQGVIDFVFSGELPNATFVEVEDGNGNSINVGEWFKRDDGYSVLRLNAAPVQQVSVPDGWRSMVDRLASTVENLNEVARGQITDDMEDPDYEHGLCDKHDDLVREARAMLDAAPAAPAADAGIVDMYRHLQKVTPYRFKKIQDASITDGGDVMYFHKDRFDAALLADMAAHCAAKGVV